MTTSPVELTDIESLAGLFPAFEFERMIARGEMGAVYKARQRSLDRDVAIKILPRELGADYQFRATFQAEVKSMARLNHPNLVKVFDFGDVDGFLYIVMEYVPGKSLFHASHGVAIDAKQAVEIIMGVCHGLSHAHDMGVSHRAIKPANILLTLQCEAKIGDFGLGRKANPYAAPEITAHSRNGDVRSEVHAIGMVLRELLTGVPAGQGEIPPLSDATLAAICKRATHSDPAMRYPDMPSLLASLSQWMASKTQKSLVTGKPVPLSKPVLAGKPVLVSKPLVTGAGPKPAPLRAHAAMPARKHPPLAWQITRQCAIIALLLCAIFATWGVYQKGNREIAGQAAGANPIHEARVKPGMKSKEIRQSIPEESSFQSLARLGRELDSESAPSSSSP